MTTKTEALKLTDEQIEDFVFKHGGKWDGNHWTFEDADLHPFFRSIEALAQPAVPEGHKQEPVAEIVSDVNGYLSTRWHDEWTPNHGDKLYTSPPKRKEWVGMGHENIQEVRQRCGSMVEAVQYINNWLKEKNT